MVDYSFYENCYLGSVIPESVFPQLSRKARSFLEKMEALCTVAGGEEAKSMAVCAMAEVLYAWQKHSGIKGTTIGGVSVQYEENQGPVKRALWDAAGIYLDIYRGVKGCP